MIKFYNDRSKEMKEKEKSQKKKILEEKDRVLAEANKKIEAAIQEIKKEQAKKEVVQKAKNEMLAERKLTGDELSEINRQDMMDVEPEEIHKNDHVFIRTMDLEGTALSEIDEDQQVHVAVGSLRLRVNVRQLMKIDKVKNSSPVKQKIEWNTDDVSNELDLRGLITEEAIYEVDKYLTDAGILGYREVTLLHGKGDGILRKKIGEFLKNDKRVDKYRLGQWGEGDTGVTVVTLRD